MLPPPPPVSATCRSPAFGDPGANRKSIFHRCHPIMLAFVWESTQKNIGQEGSVSAAGTFLEDRSGVPGVWSKWVQDGQVSAIP